MSGFGVEPGAGSHRCSGPMADSRFERTHWEAELLPAVGSGVAELATGTAPARMPRPHAFAGSLDGLRVGVAAGGRLRDGLKST